jgi:hypothetical protein
MTHRNILSERRNIFSIFPCKEYKEKEKEKERAQRPCYTLDTKTKEETRIHYYSHDVVEEYRRTK